MMMTTMMMMMITPLPFPPSTQKKKKKKKKWAVWTCCSTHPCTILLASGVLALKESSRLCFYKENSTLYVGTQHACTPLVTMLTASNHIVYKDTHTTSVGKMREPGSCMIRMTSCSLLPRTHAWIVVVRGRTRVRTHTHTHTLDGWMDGWMD